DDPKAIADYANNRPLPGTRSGNRLYAFESGMTLTGAKADHRFPVKTSRASLLAFALAKALRHEGLALPTGIPASILDTCDIAAAALACGLHAGDISALAHEMAAAKMACVALAGPFLPKSVHVACDLINAMLKSACVRKNSGLDAASAQLLTHQEMTSLLQRMASGAFSAAIFWRTDPAAAFAADNLWQRAASATKVKVHIGRYADETSAACGIVLPENHWLESWADLTDDGNRILTQQPAISPLYDTLQGEDILLGLVSRFGHMKTQDYNGFLKDFWHKHIYPSGHLSSFEAFWSAVLHDGIHITKPDSASLPGLRSSDIDQALAAATTTTDSGGLELTLKADPRVYDGRYANNGWLQELPDPVSKLTWGNALMLSTADMQSSKLSDGDLVRLSADGPPTQSFGGRSTRQRRVPGSRTIEIPVLTQPGQAQGSVTAYLGYGRRTGAVATGIGADLYPLLSFDADAPFLRRDVAITATGKKVRLPLTQKHSTTEGRDLVRSMALERFVESRECAGHAHEVPTLYDAQPTDEHKWGMAIDLNSCTGCSACVVACQSENNIPSVGPENVYKGRAMHWMRIDRYYEGDTANPKVLQQPMLCQQCDNAPCESVCPVNATNHSPDGLNQMVYNRCVGTRYCANNCPYKVRRFNFFEYFDTIAESERLVFNPEVTVRSRGVMEKCTFCVQRIQDARQHAKSEDRTLRDGEIKPACAVACPAQAIVFGDTNDPVSRVSLLSKDERGYRVLEELGARPAITYLTEMKNPDMGHSDET
ncbi:MAG: 4Fe-4S dicluster domain-containing protein, partial [Elusimicrobiota bacterium]